MDDSTNTHQHHLWTQIYSDHLWAVLHHPWQLAAVTPCWTNFYEANVLPCCCIPAFSWQNFWRLVGLAQRTSTAWNKNQWNQKLLTPLLELQGQPFGNLYTTSICLSLRSKHGQTALHKALVESSLLVQFWRLLRSRWAPSCCTMVLKKNTPRLRNNIQMLKPQHWRHIDVLRLQSSLMVWWDTECIALHHPSQSKFLTPRLLWSVCPANIQARWCPIAG